MPLGLIFWNPSYVPWDGVTKTNLFGRKSNLWKWRGKSQLAVVNDFSWGVRTCSLKKMECVAIFGMSVLWLF